MDTDNVVYKILSHIINTLIHRLMESLAINSDSFEQGSILDLLLRSVSFTRDLLPSHLYPHALSFDSITDSDSGDFPKNSFSDQIFDSLISSLFYKIPGANLAQSSSEDGLPTNILNKVSEFLGAIFGGSFNTAADSFFNNLLINQQGSTDSFFKPHVEVKLADFTPHGFFTKLEEALKSAAIEAAYSDTGFEESFAPIYNNTFDFSFSENPVRPAVISTPEFNVYISCEGIDSDNAAETGNKLLDFADNIKDMVIQAGLRDTVRYGF